MCHFFNVCYLIVKFTFRILKLEKGDAYEEHCFKRKESGSMDDN